MKNILKKSLSVLLAITIIFSSAYVGLGEVDFSGIKSEDFFAIKSKAASTSDLTFALNSEGNSYSVTDCKESASGSLTIPSTYNGKPVTSIGNSAFYRCSSITSITLPDSVTSIGSSAFYYCTSLTSIVIPDGVTSIGNSAFSYCTGLTSITIPDGVTSIGGSAFYSCSSLTSITIPDSVTSIGNYAFYYCTGLTSITIPDSVTSIGSSAFYNCTGLTDVYYGGTESDWANIAIGSSNSYLTNATINCIADILTFTLNSDGASYSVTACDEEFSGEIVIPSTYNGKPVTSIGDEAFSYCTGLTSITIPDSVTSIGYNTFYYCTGLTSITIPDSVTSIGISAFSYCPSLTSITIPDSVTSIGNYAFQYCTGLTSITIPDSVTSIGVSVFDSCSSLTSITIPDSVTSIGNDAFYYTGYYNNSSNWENDVLYIGNHLIKAKTSLTGQYIIKTGTKTISAKAFFNCTGLTSITIPDSVTSIGDDAFYRCLSLTSITIPDSVTSIGDNTFYYCTGLTSITIPDSVTSIGDWAFYNTGYYNNSSNWENDVLYIGNHLIEAKTSLTGQYIIKTGTKTISYYAFEDCTKLTSITIPDSVTSIGNSAFYYCTGLTDVYYGGTEADWANIAIGTNNSYLTNATIHYAVETVPEELVFTLNSDGESYSVTDCDNSASGSLTIPSIYNGKPVTSIGRGAFSYCTGLTSITIPDSVTSIGDSAFYGCTGLTSITIPDSVTSIGDSAFYGCLSLTSITIPDSVTSIGDFAFYYCTGLTSITIPDSVTSIGDSAFDRCSSLTSITIPDSVTSIGNDAFYFTGYYDNSSNWENDVLYIGNHLIKAKTSLTGQYIIKTGTKTISAKAFFNCTGLTSITIPDSVTSIGDDAFYRCLSLTSITIPDSVTSIGDNTFYYCTGLTDVYYGGTESDWANIVIGSSNSYLTNATIHYHEHSYNSEWIVDIEPTCTEVGSRYNTCSTCDGLVIEKIPATGHQTTEWITEKEPTCVEPGSKDEWCLECFEIVNTEEIPATGHQTTEWITEKEPTCVEPGSKDEWCLDCFEIINTEEIPALGHSYGDWIIDTEPTCTEDGSKHQICSVCDYVKTETILSEGHSFSTEWTIDVAPTCTEEGSKSHHCTACEEITDVTVVEALGHTYSTEWTIDVKATCTEEGSKSHHCIVCNNAKEDVTVVEPMGHNFSVVSVANEHPHIVLSECSRCTATQENESYSDKCGACNFTYTDNGDGTCKITAYTGSSAYMIIPASIDGKTVATTNTGAFKNITTLTSVKIENGVQGIGSLAFLGCSSLSSVVIPESVTNIGSKAFYSCSSDLTIYCYRNSYAMQYAIDNGHNYVIIDIGETDNCTIDYDNKVIFTNDSFTTSLDEIVELPSTAEASVQASIVNGDKEIFGTGSVITITDGDITSEYTLIINGDLNGDATCDVIDASVAYLYSVGLQEATENEILAANGCASDELDAASYQNVVNMMLAS